ncbi:hypothetical protein FACS1894160_3130 [Bacteroidia bacterium]|nr:hypothetical protein FACS1894123_05420 [Bacteroidia bacterium]GHV08588.1 hypothetical protein FACS1894160_3130 [Bacteroidia bacterium]
MEWIGYLHWKEIHHRFFKKGLLIPDTISTKIDLSAYGLVVYGTIENNLFLQKYKSQFPFKMEGNTIIVDRQYTEPNIKLITCLPNPQNQKLGMVIYTAVKNKDIIDINNVFHGPEDYILFIDKDHVLKKVFIRKQMSGRSKINYS